MNTEAGDTAMNIDEKKASMESSSSLSLGYVGTALSEMIAE
jgi:hypothetical protein